MYDMSDIEGVSEDEDSEEPNRYDERMVRMRMEPIVTKAVQLTHMKVRVTVKRTVGARRKPQGICTCSSIMCILEIDLFFCDCSVENLKWIKKYREVKVREFSEESSPTTRLPGSALLMFFTQELMEMIVDLYAATTLKEAYDQWTKITVDELKAYFGFLILIGLVPLPSMYDYWSRSQRFHYSSIADRIPRDRFLDIHKFLHFINNTSFSPYGSPNYNKLGKVQPVIDYLNTK